MWTSQIVHWQLNPYSIKPCVSLQANQTGPMQLQPVTIVRGWCPLATCEGPEEEWYLLVLGGGIWEGICQSRSHHQGATVHQPESSTCCLRSAP